MSLSILCTCTCILWYNTNIIYSVVDFEVEGVGEGGGGPCFSLKFNFFNVKLMLKSVDLKLYATAPPPLSKPRGYFITYALALVVKGTPVTTTDICTVTLCIFIELYSRYSKSFRPSFS